MDIYKQELSHTMALAGETETERSVWEWGGGGDSSSLPQTDSTFKQILNLYLRFTTATVAKVGSFHVS